MSGQVRRVAKAIRREMRRHAALEAVIGHLKDDHRMRRNHNAAVGSFVNFYGGDSNAFLSGNADPNERGPVAE